jgi:hypothetical protein
MIKTPFKKNELSNALKKTNKDIVHFESIPEPNYDMTYKAVTLELIKYFTTLARKTPEFRNFMFFVKTFLDVSKCSFYDEYSMKNGFSIELHHYPFSLFDLCEAVATRQLKEDSCIKSFFVIETVVILHYKFMVGLTPLNPTAHDLAHNNELEIHPKIIIGEWKEFYKEYFPYLSKTALAKYDRLIELEKKEDNPVFPDILKLNPQRIIVDGISNEIDYKKLNNLIVNKKINEISSLVFKEG